MCYLVPALFEIPLPAPVFNLHPESHPQNKLDPVSRQTYCGPSPVFPWGIQEPPKKGWELGLHVKDTTGNGKFRAPCLSLGDTGTTNERGKLGVHVKGTAGSGKFRTPVFLQGWHEPSRKGWELGAEGTENGKFTSPCFPPGMAGTIKEGVLTGS